MKPIFLFLLITFSVTTSFSQHLSYRHHQAINTYYKAINQYVGEMDWTMDRLDRYDNSAERLKLGTRRQRLDCKCVSSKQITFYAKAKASNKVLPVKTAKALNKALDALNETYSVVIQKNKELDVYVKLEDYKQDNLKKSDQLLAEQELLYKKFSRQQKYFDKLVRDIYAKQPKNGTANKAYIQMNEAITKAGNLLDIWQYNMDSGTPTQEFPFEAFVTYINYLDSLGTSAPDYRKQLPKQLQYDYKQFRKNITTVVVKTLRSALNKHTYKNRLSNLTTNRAYDNLHNYYNGLMITWINRFVTNAQKAGYACTMKAKYSPVFRLRSQAKHYVLDPSPYKKITVPSIQYQSKNRAISRNTAKALNYYTDFINRDVSVNGYLYRDLASYNKSMNFYLMSNGQSYSPSFTYHEKEEFPYAEFYRALYNSKFIPERSRKALNNRMQNLLNIAHEREALEQLLENYTRDRGYKQDNFRRGIELLKRFELILNEYDQYIAELINELKKVYDTYKIDNANNKWRISGEDLAELTDNSLDLLRESKSFCRDSSGVMPNTQIVNKQLRRVISNKYTNMDGIYKLGRNHGHCPHTPYDDLPKFAKRLADKADDIDFFLKKKQPSARQTDFYAYKDLQYQYNEIVYKHNKFVWLSMGETEVGRREIKKPVYLLNRVKQPLYYKYRGAKKPIKQDTKVPKEKSEVKASTPEQGEMKGYAYNNLVLLLDVSSSMRAPHKFPLLKESFVELLNILRSQDEVALISYSGKAQVVLPPISCGMKDSIASVINKLRARGGTDAQKGLKLAYKSAKKNFIEKGNNRIILATDGQFRLTDKDFKRVKKYAEQGIHLTLFYFGDVKKELPTLKKLTDAGNGNYVLINQENMILKLKEEVKAIKLNDR